MRSKIAPRTRQRKDESAAQTLVLLALQKVSPLVGFIFLCAVKAQYHNLWHGAINCSPYMSVRGFKAKVDSLHAFSPV